MAKFSVPVLGVALFFDVLAFGLACGASAKRSKGTPQYAALGYLACKYTKDTASGLAASAFVFLLIGQLVITVATSCFCCGKVTYKRGFGRVCAVLLLIFSWLSFIIAEIFLLTGAILNNTRTIGQLDQGVYRVDDAFSKNVKKTMALLSGLPSLFSQYFPVLCTTSYELGRAPKNSNGLPTEEKQIPTASMTAYN